jgi:short-subunit dehydrogenase
MDLGIVSKRALVTGATQGIGKEIAKQLLTAGTDVIITGRNTERLDTVVADLSSLGRVTGIASDLSTADGAA